MSESPQRPAPVRPATDTELLSTLFELGREVMSVLDLADLLEKIPQLIARLTRFSAFSVYLLDEQRQELHIAYAVGYPEDVVRTLRLRVGQGVVGAAVEQGRPILVNDISKEPRFMGPLRNMVSQLAVPMRRKGRVIGALNLLSDTSGAFTDQDEALLRQFAAHVAVAIENARLFRSERHYTATLETLAEIGREMSSILDLDVLLTRIASLTKRLIDYRTFGIFLLNDATNDLEMKLAVRYGEEGTAKNVKLGEGLVGWSALHKEPVLVADVSKDPRYINLIEDVRSELVIPMLIKERCIGVFDLESPELKRLYQGTQGAADAARQPGGGRDRKRAAVRSRCGATRSGSRRSCASRSACRRRCCQPSRRPAFAQRTSRDALPRRTSSEAISTTSSRRSRTASSWRWVTSPARARPRRSTARLPRSSCDRARCAAAIRPTSSAWPACCSR